MKKEELSYIAGFLDGDGCVMLQLITRKDYRLGYEIRPSIVFYQKDKDRNREFLLWIKKKLKEGYIRDRKDGMTEYVIVGKKPVESILLKISPFLRLKKEHAKVVLAVLKKMPEKGNQMTAKNLLKLSKEVDKFFFLNYSKKRTNTSQKVNDFLMSNNLLIP
ncbi:MAG: LAGLIDADG family homing endonuclease [Patescibacteria group bacterium]